VVQEPRNRVQCRGVAGRQGGSTRDLGRRGVCAKEGEVGRQVRVGGRWQVCRVAGQVGDPVWERVVVGCSEPRQ